MAAEALEKIELKASPSAAGGGGELLPSSLSLCLAAAAEGTTANHLRAANSVLLHALAAECHLDQAIELLGSMQSRDIRPTEQAIGSLLLGAE